MLINIYDFVGTSRDLDPPRKADGTEHTAEERRAYETIKRREVRRELKSLLEYSRKQKLNTVVLGDFNNTLTMGPRDNLGAKPLPMHELSLMAMLRGTHSSAVRIHRPTAPFASHIKGRHIDHAFLDPQLAIAMEGAGIDNLYAKHLISSDHWPCWCDTKLHVRPVEIKYYGSTEAMQAYQHRRVSNIPLKRERGTDKLYVDCLLADDKQKETIRKLRHHATNHPRAVPLLLRAMGAGEALRIVAAQLGPQISQRLYPFVRPLLNAMQEDRVAAERMVMKGAEQTRKVYDTQSMRVRMRAQLIATQGISREPTDNDPAQYLWNHVEQGFHRIRCRCGTLSSEIRRICQSAPGTDGTTRTWQHIHNDLLRINKAWGKAARNYAEAVNKESTTRKKWRQSERQRKDLATNKMASTAGGKQLAAR